MPESVLLKLKNPDGEIRLSDLHKLANLSADDIRGFVSSAARLLPTSSTSRKIPPRTL